MILRSASKIIAVAAIAMLSISGLMASPAYAVPYDGAQQQGEAFKAEAYETLPVIAGLSRYYDAVSVLDGALRDTGMTADQMALIYDKDTYVALNPDVAATFGDDEAKLLEHFITAGMREARVASPVFDVNSYFLQYPDLRASFGLDMAKYYHHYATIGVAEGRASAGYSDPSGVGDAAIRGKSKATVAQMAAAFRASGHAFPMATYARYGASSIEVFCTILTEEATAEGIRAEVVFAQCMHETGWLQFHGDVSGSQCNFAGLGVYGGSTGAVFNDWGANSVRKGLRAEIQHLMAYCTTAKLANECVDPRFSLITRGCAPTVYDLGGKWAVPGDNYGNAIMGIVSDVLSR